jgi:hypothetical protein
VFRGPAVQIEVLKKLNSDQRFPFPFPPFLSAS